ncbi:MAG: AAA family ATPase [Spirochaetales bacterium]|nr:MAG: AAA family ATPase [Spirochaetales bacterium]
MTVYAENVPMLMTVQLTCQAGNTAAQARIRNPGYPAHNFYYGFQPQPRRTETNFFGMVIAQYIQRVILMWMQILFTFVGNKDPYANEAEAEYGPVLSHLSAVSYDRVYLFCTGTAYAERAKTVEHLAREEIDHRKFYFVNIDLASPIDYEEIYTKLLALVENIVNKLPSPDTDIAILLDPGTRQMQTSWFLLVRSGLLKAKLLQGIPPRFAAGRYKVREVDLRNSVLPEIVPLLPAGKNDPRPKQESRGTSPASPYEDGGRWVAAVKTKLIGRSEPFLKALATAQRIAAYDDISILLLGETGTGKGLFAKHIHELSGRRDKSFIELNCSALSPTLVESELFGHVKGAFTGAHADRLGMFRSADGGAVFLDEIGDLPLEIQPKLLKVLEEKTLTPLGGDKAYIVDVRIIAATNQPIETFISAGRFRRDLYERLKHVDLTLPPLRERGEDIKELAEVFLASWNDRYGDKKEFTGGCWKALSAYGWPGNVRELQNTITSLCARSQGGTLGEELLPWNTRQTKSEETAAGKEADSRIPEDGLDLKAVLYQTEKSYYEEALKVSDNNREQAAKLLGLNPPAFRKALKERFGM